MPPNEETPNWLLVSSGSIPPVANEDGSEFIDVRVSCWEMTCWVAGSSPENQSSNSSSVIEAMSSGHMSASQSQCGEVRHGHAGGRLPEQAEDRLHHRRLPVVCAGDVGGVGAVLSLPVALGCGLLRLLPGHPVLIRHLLRLVVVRLLALTLADVDPRTEPEVRRLESVQRILAVLLVRRQPVALRLVLVDAHRLPQVGEGLVRCA